jgi:hypothetical protein
MKKLVLSLDTSRPETAITSSSAAGRSANDQGYVVLDSKGVLCCDRVFVYFEGAQQEAGTSNRVVARKWYEKRMKTKILTE